MSAKLFYVAYNASMIKIHFKTFSRLINYVSHLKQSFDDFTVEIHCGDNIIDTHKLSEFEYYREEDGYHNPGISHIDYYNCDICPHWECVGCKLRG